MLKRAFLFAAVISVCGAAASQTPPLPTVAGPASGHSVRIMALELALSNIVTEKPNLWRFDALEVEAAKLLQASQTPQERDAVRAIAERIDRFAAIGQRYRQTRGAAAMAAPVTPLESPRIDPERATVAGRDYDAIGVLRPVVSKRADAPKFALIDDQGKVATLLTPSPDLNLQALVGKRIGVRGTRGFIPEYHRSYIAASRATPLDTVRR